MIAFPLGGDGGRADSLASVAAAASSALDASPNYACGPISRNPRARCMKRSRRGRPDIISAGFRDMVKTNWEREEADLGCSPEVSALHTPRPSAHTSLQLAGLAQCLAQCLSWHKHHNHGATPPRLTLKDLAELGAMQMSEKLSMS